MSHRGDPERVVHFAATRRLRTALSGPNHIASYPIPQAFGLGWQKSAFQAEIEFASKSTLKIGAQ
jgi:hypothetical protein